jgi:outer membrane protein
MHAAVRLTALVLALAAAPAARAELKLGYVDFQRAIKEVEEGKVTGATLKKYADEKQKELNGRSDEVKRLQDELQKQAQILTPEARTAKVAEVERKMMEAQEIYMRLQQDLSAREREAMRPLSDKLIAVAREIAEADGFTMIFDRDSAGLVFAPASLDLTNELIRKYNAKFPVGAKAAAAPPRKADAPAPKADAPAKK